MGKIRNNRPSKSFRRNSNGRHTQEVRHNRHTQCYFGAHPVARSFGYERTLATGKDVVLTDSGQNVVVTFSLEGGKVLGKYPNKRWFFEAQPDGFPVPRKETPAPKAKAKGSTRTQRAEIPPVSHYELGGIGVELPNLTAARKMAIKALADAEGRCRMKVGGSLTENGQVYGQLVRKDGTKQSVLLA